MNINPNILIFSVFQKGLPEIVNRMAHDQFLEILEREGFPVLSLSGRYNGVDELLILIENFDHREIVERLCREFNQESYLESHNDGTTFLVYPDGRRELIGKMTHVSETEAKAASSYSYSPLRDQYFVTK